MNLDLNVVAASGLDWLVELDGVTVDLNASFFQLLLPFPASSNNNWELNIENVNLPT